MQQSGEEITNLILKSPVILVCIQNSSNIDITVSLLYNHFQNCGQIQRILVFDRSAMIWKAFVEFKNGQQAAFALKNAERKLLNLNIEVYESKLPIIKFNVKNSYAKDFTSEPTISQSVNLPQKQQESSSPQMFKSQGSSVNKSQLMNQLRLQFLNDQMELIKSQQKQLMSLLQSENSNSSQVTGALSTADLVEERIVEEEIIENDISLPIQYHVSFMGEKMSQLNQDFDKLVSQNLDLLKLVDAVPSDKDEVLHQSLQPQTQNENYQDPTEQNVKLTSSCETIIPRILPEQKGLVTYVRWFNKQDVNMKMIYNIFSTFGNIEKMIFFTEKFNVLIQYTSDASAKFLINNFTGLTFYGQKLKAYPSNYKEIFFKERPTDEEHFIGGQETFRFKDNNFRYLVAPSQTLHVANLKREFCDEVFIKDLFQKYGQVETIKIIVDENNRNKCLVKFKTVEQALTALAHMHNTDLNGRRIQIFFSQMKI